MVGRWVVKELKYIPASSTLGGRGSASTTKLSGALRMLEVVVVVEWPWRCLVVLT